MSITPEKYIALFGLSLAFVEIHIPKLSMLLELYINKSKYKLKDIYKTLYDFPRSIRNIAGDRTYIGLFYRNNNKIFILTFIIILVTTTIIEEYLPLKWFDIYFNIIAIPLVLITLVIFIYSLAIYLYYTLIYIPFKIISLFIFLLKWTIHGLNFIGNKKAISGIGLALAIQGVLA